jgi:hypothetical protein
MDCYWNLDTLLSHPRGVTWGATACSIIGTWIYVSSGAPDDRGTLFRKLLYTCNYTRCLYQSSIFYMRRAKLAQPDPLMRSQLARLKQMGRMGHELVPPQMFALVLSGFPSVAAAEAAVFSVAPPA